MMSQPTLAHSPPTPCASVYADFRPAILAAHPDDDLSRLVMADALDETGDAAAAAWARFMRLQCEQATLPKCATPNDSCDCGRCRIEREAVRLYDQAGAVWSKPFVTYSKAFVLHWHRGFPAFVLHWHRGFPSRFRGTLGSLFGGECDRCGGDGRDYRYHGHADDLPRCPNCLGEGHIGGIAKRLFLSQPVTQVDFSDRNSQPDPNAEIGWIRQSSDPRSIRSDKIPDVLFDRLKGGRYKTDAVVWVQYDSTGLAETALSDAACVYGRSLVGLPV